MTRLKKLLMYVGLIASLLLISCSYFGTQKITLMDNSEIQLRCSRWNVNGQELAEVDARLWCFTMNLDKNTNTTCISSYANLTTLTLNIESQKNNSTDYLSYNYDDCVEKQEVIRIN